MAGRHKLRFSEGTPHVLRWDISRWPMRSDAAASRRAKIIISTPNGSYHLLPRTAPPQAASTRSWKPEHVFSLRFSMLTELAPLPPQDGLLAALPFCSLKVGWN